MKQPFSSSHNRQRNLVIGVVVGALAVLLLLSYESKPDFDFHAVAMKTAKLDNGVVDSTPAVLVPSPQQHVHKNGMIPEESSVTATQESSESKLCFKECPFEEFVPCSYNNNKCPDSPPPNAYVRARAMSVNLTFDSVMRKCDNPELSEVRSPFRFSVLKYPLSRPHTPMACYTRTDMVCNFLAVHGGWEAPLLQAMGVVIDRVAQKTNSTPTFVDIGANVGVFTFSMAKYGIPVISFEMMKRNIALLKATRCANPTAARRVDIRNVGLSASPATCTMISHDTNEGDATVVCNRTELGRLVKEHKYVSRGDVMLSTLDAEFPDGMPWPSVVKMDVEGHEPQVVRGAAKVLSGDRRPVAILSEVWRSIDVPGYVVFMREKGYDVWWADRNRELPDGESVKAMHQEIGAIPQNLLFIRKDMRNGIAP